MNSASLQSGGPGGAREEHGMSRIPSGRSLLGGARQEHQISRVSSGRSLPGGAPDEHGMSRIPSGRTLNSKQSGELPAEDGMAKASYQNDQPSAKSMELL